MNKELTFLRAFAVTAGVGFLLMANSAFKDSGNQKFKEIDVERINIVEKDGTVKMVITNVDRFPNGSDTINNRPTNEDRKKRSGMLFFNEDGIECGGFIYDGRKTPTGHSAGLSLTYDQYDGDQVMQLLSQDYTQDGKRYVTSSLTFQDRGENETQLGSFEIFKELEALRKKDPKLMREKYKEYADQKLIGSVPRVILGQTKSKSNGLFLFDDAGLPKAWFYVDKDNKAKLDFYDDKGNVVASLPEAQK